MMSRPAFTALEFFAGGGLARLGLAEEFATIWANDIDPMKAAAWIDNFGAAGFVQGDIGQCRADDIPRADLAWASFPCQDLSLAGGRQGLRGARSGTFFAFADVLGGLCQAGKAPHVVVIENVSGLLSSAGGADFSALVNQMQALGYQSGAVEIDARHFVPQSRPRVFVVCVRGSPPRHLINASPDSAGAHSQGSVHWALPPWPQSPLHWQDCLDTDGHTDWPHDKVTALLASVSPRHQMRLAGLRADGRAHALPAYRRMRMVKGHKLLCTELRFDGIAGCLRTPSGGSSRQFVVQVAGAVTKVRALNAREAMRLMGVPDTYRLPKGTLAGLKIAGDGVAVPVVAWLSRHLLAPLVKAAQSPLIAR